MLSDKKLLKKLRKVMGATITFPSLFACSSQISRAEVYYCSINNVNYKYDNTTKCLTISGKGEVTDWATYYRELARLGAKLPLYECLCTDSPSGTVLGVHGIEHIIIEDGITEIGEGAFQKLIEVKDIVIPNSVNKIGKSAFKDCLPLRKIKIPESVKEIQEYTFYDCFQLEEIELPNTLENIENYVFHRCRRLKSITIPPSVKKLGGNAFSKCEKLKEIKMSSNIEGITSCLFYGCKNLETIKIPSSIEYIQCNAFGGCENLSNVEFYSPNDLKSEAKLKYPNDPKGEARYWVENCPEKYRNFAHALLVMKKKTDSYIYEANKALYEFLIPRSLVIYPLAFDGCKKLKKISFPTDVRFNVETNNMKTVSVDNLNGKLSNFFEPNMKVKINGKIYCVNK